MNTVYSQLVGSVERHHLSAVSANLSWGSSSSVEVKNIFHCYGNLFRNMCHRTLLLSCYWTESGGVRKAVRIFYPLTSQFLVVAAFSSQRVTSLILFPPLVCHIDFLEVVLLISPAHTAVSCGSDATTQRNVLLCEEVFFYRKTFFWLYKRQLGFLHPKDGKIVESRCYYHTCRREAQCKTGQNFIKHTIEIK